MDRCMLGAEAYKKNLSHEIDGGGEWCRLVVTILSGALVTSEHIF